MSLLVKVAVHSTRRGTEWRGCVANANQKGIKYRVGNALTQIALRVLVHEIVLCNCLVSRNDWNKLSDHWIKVRR